MRRRLSPLIVALALLATAACSLSEGEQASADSIARALVTDSSPAADKEDADCVAGKWVGEVGVDRLTKDGLLNAKGEAAVPRVRRALSGSAKVSGPTADAYAAAWFACADFDEMALAKGKSLPKASEEDLDELADCLKEQGRSTWTDAGMNVSRVRARLLNQCAANPSLY